MAEIKIESIDRNLAVSDAIKAIMPKVTHFSHMPLTGSLGFDLYIDSPDGAYSTYHRTFVPPYDMKNGYESKVEIRQRGMNHYTIHFPLYNEVTALYIGIAEGSRLEAGAPYKDLPPVVYYGSSITQGGCHRKRPTPHPPRGKDAEITKTSTAFVDAKRSR